MDPTLKEQKVGYTLRRPSVLNFLLTTEILFWNGHGEGTNFQFLCILFRTVFITLSWSINQEFWKVPLFNAFHLYPYNRLRSVPTPSAGRRAIGLGLGERQWIPEQRQGGWVILVSMRTMEREVGPGTGWELAWKLSPKQEVVKRVNGVQYVSLHTDSTMITVNIQLLSTQLASKKISHTGQLKVNSVLTTGSVKAFGASNGWELNYLSTKNKVAYFTNIEDWGLL